MTHGEGVMFLPLFRSLVLHVLLTHSVQRCLTGVTVKCLRLDEAVSRTLIIIENCIRLDSAEIYSQIALDKLLIM